MSHVPTVLFVCLHGAAKSVVAARHLERLAAERHVALQTGSAGIEPDESVPTAVVAGLEADGLVVPEGGPRLATAELLATADVIVTFGCELPATGTLARVVRWEDVPAVSDGYAAARDAIVSRLPAVIDSLSAPEATRLPGE